jgi:hypothetical protein
VGSVLEGARDVLWGRGTYTSPQVCLELSGVKPVLPVDPMINIVVVYPQQGTPYSAQYTDFLSSIQ